MIDFNPPFPPWSACRNSAEVAWKIALEPRRIDLELELGNAGRQGGSERNNAIAGHAPAVDDGTARIETGDTTAVLTEIDSKHGNRSLDEVGLPGELVRQLIEWLYRHNRFCRGELKIGGQLVGPRSVSVPTLAVVNTEDDIALFPRLI